jgi:hypothetical protein
MVLRHSRRGSRHRPACTLLLLLLRALVLLLLWVSVQEVLAALPHFIIQLMVLRQPLRQWSRWVIKAGVQHMQHSLVHEGCKHLRGTAAAQQQHSHVAQSCTMKGANTCAAQQHTNSNAHALEAPCRFSGDTHVLCR